jgi:hypothetical protein
MKMAREIRVVLAVLSIALGCGRPAPPIEHAAAPEIRGEAPAPREPCGWYHIPILYIFPGLSSELDAVSQRPNQDRILQSLAASFPESRVQRLRVSGYIATECSDERAVAHELGLARARAVAARLIELGIPADLVEAQVDHPYSPAPESPDSCDHETLNTGRRVMIDGFICD